MASLISYAQGCMCDCMVYGIVSGQDIAPIVRMHPGTSSNSVEHKFGDTVRLCLNLENGGC
eukprot:scaffold1690_cov182-Amphora_coffeaeformis.AAC.14